MLGHNKSMQGSKLFSWFELAIFEKFKSKLFGAYFESEQALFGGRKA